MFIIALITYISCAITTIAWMMYSKKPSQSMVNRHNACIKASEELQQRKEEKRYHLSANVPIGGYTRFETAEYDSYVHSN
jgi:hypothetical protein